jgi:sporulation protein YlmC with PRC-barrel domain
LSKGQKDESSSKGKLIGKSVIDQEGNMIGVVKDVGFTPGKSGLSLTVENVEGEMREISWDVIQGAADFVVLKPSQQISNMPAQNMQQPQPVQYHGVQSVQPIQTQPMQSVQPAQPLCPICRGPLTWIPQYKRWYCYKDQKYA